MELAKVTSKGQVTIPIEIRRRLGIKNGEVNTDKRRKLVQHKMLMYQLS